MKTFDDNNCYMFSLSHEFSTTDENSTYDILSYTSFTIEMLRGIRDATIKLITN